MGYSTDKNVLEYIVEDTLAWFIRLAAYVGFIIALFLNLYYFYRGDDGRLHHETFS